MKFYLWKILNDANLVFSMRIYIPSNKIVSIKIAAISVPRSGSHQVSDVLPRL